MSDTPINNEDNKPRINDQSIVFNNSIAKGTFFPYSFFVIAIAVISVLAGNIATSIACGLAGLIALIASVFQLNPAKMRKGMELMAFANCVVLITFVVRLITAKSFLMSGFFILTSGALAFYSMNALMSMPAVTIDVSASFEEPETEKKPEDDEPPTVMGVG